MFNVSQRGLKESFYKGAKKLLERLLSNDKQTMNFKMFMIIITGVFGGITCCLYQIKWSRNLYLACGTISSFAIILAVYLLHRNFQYDNISKINYCVLWGLIALNEITSIILNYYMHGTKWPNQSSLFRFYTIIIFIFSVYTSGALLCAIFGPIKKLTKEPIIYFEKISIILLAIGGIISFFVSLLWFIGIILVLVPVLRQLLDYFKISLPAQITKKEEFIKDTDVLEQQLLLVSFGSIVFKILISLISTYSPIYRIIQPSFDFAMEAHSFWQIVEGLSFVFIKVVIIVLLMAFIRKGIIWILNEVGRQIEHTFRKL